MRDRQRAFGSRTTPSACEAPFLAAALQLVHGAADFLTYGRTGILPRVSREVALGWMLAASVFVLIHAFGRRPDRVAGPGQSGALADNGSLMREIETDYLVVGAGASGMAFVDEVVARSDAEVVLVDRQHQPGGHWLAAYPFVRLHQPSAYYGVSSRILGTNRIDEHGPNAGFYERATAPEICGYFQRVLEEDLIPTGRVRFAGMTDYRGEDADGHHLVSQLTGESTVVRVRRKVVDATYVRSEIPARHEPGFAIGAGVRVVPPNDLVEIHEPANSYVIVGAGKTAMDTCCWLLDVGVDPDRIRWIRTRESWLFDRASTQPLELVASSMRLQASWVAAAARAEDSSSFAHLLEDDGIFVRIDPTIEPGIWRGATISRREVDALRSIEQVVRRGRVLGISSDRMRFENGELESSADDVYVDCTAAGTPPWQSRPVFEPGRITLLYVTVGMVPFSAATVAAVETSGAGEEEKNRLCPPLGWTGEARDILTIAFNGLVGLSARFAEPELRRWMETCRLNPVAGAQARRDDPEVAGPFALMVANLGPALENLTARAAVSV